MTATETDEQATDTASEAEVEAGSGPKTDPAEEQAQTAGDTGAEQDSAAGESTAPRKTVAGALGEIAWLLSQSPNHRHALFLADLEWLAMPPLMHNQYRLFYANGRPIGVAFWAFVTETVEQRLAAGGRIGTEDWRSGDRVWLVELIAPFGNQEAMLEDLRKTALADRKFRFIRTHPNGRRETVELGGEAVQ